MQMIDAPRSAALKMYDPRAALAGGDMRTDNVPALENFEQAFSFDAEALERARARFEADTGRASVYLGDATPFVFRYLLDEAFVGGGADRTEVLHFNVVGSGAFTVTFDADSLEITRGFVGDPTARILTGRETFGAMTYFKILSESAAAKQIQADLTAKVGQELQDFQLALVAGGKEPSQNHCASAYGCTVDGGGACAPNTVEEVVVVGCSGDYCAVDGCGANGSCGADVGGLSGCGLDFGGGVGVCYADGCVVAGCAADGCLIAGCGADGCGAAACHTEACGAAACLADACLAAFCGADLAPFDACLADVCGVNIIPFVPLI